MSKSGSANFSRLSPPQRFAPRACGETIVRRQVIGVRAAPKDRSWGSPCLSAPLEPYRKPVFSDGASISLPFLPCSRTMEFSILLLFACPGRTAPAGRGGWFGLGFGRSACMFSNMRFDSFGSRRTSVPLRVGNDCADRFSVRDGILRLAVRLCTGPDPACGGPQAIPAPNGCRRFPK